MKTVSKFTVSREKVSVSLDEEEIVSFMHDTAIKLTAAINVIMK